MSDLLELIDLFTPYSYEKIKELESEFHSLCAQRDFTALQNWLSKSCDIWSCDASGENLKERQDLMIVPLFRKADHDTKIWLVNCGIKRVITFKMYTFYLVDYCVRRPDGFAVIEHILSMAKSNEYFPGEYDQILSEAIVFKEPMYFVSSRTEDAEKHLSFAACCLSNLMESEYSDYLRFRSDAQTSLSLSSLCNAKGFSDEVGDLPSGIPTKSTFGILFKPTSALYYLYCKHKYDYLNSDLPHHLRHMFGHQEYFIFFELMPTSLRKAFFSDDKNLESVFFFLNFSGGNARRTAMFLDANKLFEERLDHPMVQEYALYLEPEQFISQASNKEFEKMIRGRIGPLMERIASAPHISTTNIESCALINMIYNSEYLGVTISHLKAQMSKPAEEISDE